MAVALNMALTLVASALLPVAGHAQSILADPTRPPPEFLAGGADRSIASTAAGGGQIIILSTARNQVTQNGQTASVGGRLGDATVTGLSDSEVQTRSAGKAERSKLYVGIEKRPANGIAAQPGVPTKGGAR